MVTSGGGRDSVGAVLVACSNVGGGESGMDAGVGFASKVGGKRDEEDVGNGNGGGASSFSGTSVPVSDFLTWNRRYIPSHTFKRRILAPLAKPIARPSSLELTVKRRDIPGPSSPLTIRLRLLFPAAGVCDPLFPDRSSIVAGGSDSMIRPK
jgi:hypothetical protein